MLSIRNMRVDRAYPNKTTVLHRDRHVANILQSSNGLSTKESPSIQRQRCSVASTVCQAFPLSPTEKHRVDWYVSPVVTYVKGAAFIESYIVKL